MNFKKLFLLSFAVFFMFGLVSCDKRGKLLTNTMILQIKCERDSNNAISLTTIGEKTQLEAIIRNTKLEEVSEPVSWQVSPSDLGHFLPDNNAKSPIFFADKTGEGTITLHCQGVSVSVKVKVE